MSGLSLPNASQREENTAVVRTGSAKNLQPTSVDEFQIEAVLSVDLSDTASRRRAREAVGKLTSDSASLSRSRLIERRLLALAQADSGGNRIAVELQMLATKARELDSTYAKPRRFGLFGKRSHATKSSAGDMRATVEELNVIVRSLSSAAEVLRQNNVAFKGFESDLVAEHQRVTTDVERAEDYRSALVVAIEQAKVDGAASDTIRFAQTEVLFPLESHRQYLQNLLAVNQQAMISLAILRETNDMLISHVRMIALAARNALDVAAKLQYQAADQVAARSYDEVGMSSGMEDLHVSLGELFRVLEEHEVWRRESDVKKERAIVALSELSAKVFDEHDSGVAS